MSTNDLAVNHRGLQTRLKLSDLKKYVESVAQSTLAEFLCNKEVKDQIFYQKNYIYFLDFWIIECLCFIFVCLKMCVLVEWEKFRTTH